MTQTPTKLPPAPVNVSDLQKKTIKGVEQDEIYQVSLVLDNDNVYQVDLPRSILVSLINPKVTDGFIKVKVQAVSTGLLQGAGSHRFIHTSFIREIVFNQDLPDILLGGA